VNGADAFEVATELIGPRGRKVVALGFFLGVLLFHGTTMHIFNWLVSQRAQELSTVFIHAATPPTKS
jgi:hypothetical protein